MQWQSKSVITDLFSSLWQRGRDSEGFPLRSSPFILIFSTSTDNEQLARLW
jgi:hypothetical protein